MKKYIGVLLVVLMGSVAHAGEPPIQITFPVEGECVNNGDEIFRGGIVGGEAQAQPIDVPLVFNAYSFDGADLGISFLIEWTAMGLDGAAIQRSEMYEAILQLPANEVVEVDQFPVPGFFIEDADDVRITVRSTHPVDGIFEDSVVFDLDRRAPTVVMQPGDLANAQSACDANPPPFAYSLTDERTPEADIISDIRTEVNGCVVNRIITVRDTCGTGNAQELTITSAAPAAPNSITVAIQGYRCTVDGCVTEGDDAMPFNDGDRVSMPTFLPVVDAPQGCASSVAAVVMRAEDIVEQCPAEPPSVVGGAGDECVQDGDCSGQQTCTNGFCAEPMVCAADIDCRGGRLCRDEGCVSPCLPLEGGRVFDDAGDYLARVRVSDCGGNQVETSMSVTVLERPIALPGGNLPNGDYQVRQGEALVLDGSTSFAAPEVGGITEYAWDLDGDGFFNFDSEVFGGGQPTVEFDTFQSGTFRRRLRVTAGNGTTAYAWFNVIVEDVDPICSAGGPYEVAEGEALRLDARASQAGHEGDPIQFYSWDFGDGFRPQSGAGLREPLHIYRDARNEPFVVTLTVADPDSEAQCTALVTVRDVEPQLDGVTVLNPQAAIEGETLRFEAQARPGSQADPLTYFAWQFGPIGATAEGPARRTAEYSYQDHGTYDVCVTVQDEDSSVEECVAVEIEDLQPFVSLEGPNRGLQGEELVFDASSTQAGGPSDALTMLVWNWGDGSNLETVQVGNNLPNQFVGRHIYPEDGEYTITLRVVDEDSAAVVQHVVTIEDAEPTADFTFAYPGLERTIPEGVDLLLDASNSQAGANTDPIEAYIWNFGDGNELTLAANQVGVTYSWADEGAYEVRLTARDDDGSESTQMRIIEVTNRPPQVSLQTETNQVAIGEDILFVAVSGEVPDGQGARVVALVDDVAGDLPPARVSWDMGDGSQIESGSHRYAYNVLGQKVVRVTIDDGDGGVTEEEIILNVTPAAPAIEAVPPQTVSEGEQLSFDVLVQAPVIGPGVFDQIEVNTVESPPGSDVEYIAEDNNIRVRFTWRPTFYDSGYHRLWLRANSSKLNDSASSISTWTTQVCQGLSLSVAGHRAACLIFTITSAAFVTLCCARIQRSNSASASVACARVQMDVSFGSQCPARIRSPLSRPVAPVLWFDVCLFQPCRLQPLSVTNMFGS